MSLLSFFTRKTEKCLSCNKATRAKEVICSYDCFSKYIIKVFGPETTQLEIGLFLTTVERWLGKK